MIFTYSIKYSEIKTLLLFFFLAEIVLAVLALFDPLFLFGIILLAVALPLFYYSMLRGPFIWIIFMVLASAMDSWGRLFAGLTIFHVTWFFAILTTIIYYLQNHDKKLRIKTPINKYFISFIIFGSFSLLYSYNYTEGLLINSVAIALFMSFIVFVNFLTEEKHFRNLVNSLAVINILLGALTFMQLVYQNVLYFGTATVELETGDKVWRPSGTFEDPNLTAVFLMIGVIFSASIIFFSKENKRMKLFHSFSIFISMLGIIATFSRTGWVALVFGLVSIFFFARKYRVLLYLSFAMFAMLVGFVLLTPYGEFLISRGFSIFDVMGDISIRIRIVMLVSSIWMWMDYPLLGVGLRSYSFYYPYYLHPDAPQVMLYMKESHTLWVTLLAELGIIGFTIVFLWFKRIFIDIFNLRNIQHTYIRAVTIGAFGIYFAFNIVFLFYGFLFPHFNLIWLVLGIIYAISLNRDKLENESDQ